MNEQCPAAPQATHSIYRGALFCGCRVRFCGLLRTALRPGAPRSLGRRFGHVRVFGTAGSNGSAARTFAALVRLSHTILSFLEKLFLDFELSLLFLLGRS